MTKNRQGNIDGARGLISIGIVFYHYTVVYQQYFESSYPIIIVYKYGNMGVIFLFMLSSYFLMRKIQTKRMDATQYIFQRIFRLWPSYAMAVVITGGFLIITNSTLKSSVVGILVNLTMLNKLIGIPYVDGVYHTLTNELILLAISALFFMTKLYKNPKAVIFLWGGGICIEPYYFNYLRKRQ